MKCINASSTLDWYYGLMLSITLRVLKGKAIPVKKQSYVNIQSG
jgi:hypothetical protein